MKPLLVFENVTKVYPNGIAALQNVDFSIYEGEFVFVVGSSGAGKSTISKLSILEEKPNEGRIIFDGIDLTNIRNSQCHRLRRDIGVVFQDFRLLMNKTLYENLAFILEAMNTPKKQVEDQVLYTLDLVGLDDRKDSFPSELSGGEQQRATIARAVVSQPKLLLADEPTGNLDEQNSWDIVQLLNKINSWGTTVVVATHDKKVVDSLQRRVIALSDGKLIRDSEGGYNVSRKGKPEDVDVENGVRTEVSEIESEKEKENGEGGKEPSDVSITYDEGVSEVIEDPDRESSDGKAQDEDVEEKRKPKRKWWKRKEATKGSESEGTEEDISAESKKERKKIMDFDFKIARDLEAKDDGLESERKGTKGKKQKKTDSKESSDGKRELFMRGVFKPRKKRISSKV